jgi:uncharacterized protein (DUF1330 family)
MSHPSNPSEMPSHASIEYLYSMPAFVIVDVTIRDKKEYKEYKKLTLAAVAAYDGRFVVRGGETAIMEGSWDPERVVILEFPTVERAKEWWGSDIYSKAKVIRQRSADTNMIIVQGV